MIKPPTMHGVVDASGNATILNSDGSVATQAQLDKACKEAAAESAKFHAMNETQQRKYLMDSIKVGASPQEAAMVDAMFAMFGNGKK